MNSVIRLLHTLRYLQPSQIYGRPLHWLKRRFTSVRVPASLARQAAAERRSLLPNVRRRFHWTFLGHPLSSPCHDLPWDLAGRHPITPAGVVDPVLPTPAGIPDKLWRYNLNYFDFLFQESGFSAEEEMFLILDWIARNGDEHAEPWEPYVVSRRVRNWVRWRQCPRHGRALPPHLQDLIDTSLRFQMKRLSQDLEFHILGNHLFENFAALFVGAVHLLSCPGPETHRPRLRSWLEIGAAGLREQIREQILPDGGHYELSPMYHLDILRTLRQVHATALVAPAGFPAGPAVRGACEEVLPRMGEWLRLMTHPDGGIALFNDSVLPAETLPYPPATLGETLLPDSGYFCRRWGDGHFLVLDAGDPRPSYQTGHAHCDSLSFELSVQGRRVVVDTGMGSYHDPRIRQAGRGTAGHNVPLIEGTEQSEIWGGFRMGRRSRVEARAHDPAAHALDLTLRDYRGNRLRRRVRVGDRRLDLEDTLLERVDRGAFLSLLHLHPEIRVSPIDEHDGILSHPEIPFPIRFRSTAPWEIRAARYFPAFGPGTPNSVIRIQGTHRDSVQFSLDWSA